MTNKISVPEALEEAMLAGIKECWKMLEEDASEVAPENQTWESAIAKIKIFEFELRRGFGR